ncbi:MAG: hypothetical protein QOH23_1216, partial [Gaiellaceae bacterium]|nr:hypothetical protein [Gaiellaceae bacterium]
MLALDLRACLANLFYDQVRRVSLHHRLDLSL